MSLGFGHLARIGHLYPSGGLCDYEIQLMAPEGVQFLTTRLPFRNTGIADDLGLVENLEQHVRLLADADVDVIAVNCTAATLLAGPDRIRERIGTATGIDSVTTIEAVLAALRAAGVRRPALLTPYPDEVVEAEREFLRSHGVDVITHLSLPRATPVEQATIEPDDWFGLAASLDPSTIDGVLLSCAGIRVADQLQRIEDRLGLPVVASNQALLWHLLRTLGIPARTNRYGALLTGRFDTPTETVS
ncbi:arylmalonate decarboxylase [Streptomyces sp. NWU49]|uniref:maleate cis-trans isomerase family protein n=1 Tax=Streptomyces sp. NWU49 TaxID=2201153 RepID=UPI000D6760E0|nr:aspartate/glutamate racemase family protein [Streptomyces sp. NWU49]PWJ03279.1 arylmalonate decarboxylase [Streptomyces sp. NWU49]